MFLDIATTDNTQAFVRKTTGERFEQGATVYVTGTAHSHHRRTGMIETVYMKDIECALTGIITSIPTAVVAFFTHTVEIPTGLLTVSALS